MLIDRDAELIGHVQIYRRIDPWHPGRRSVITALDLMENGGREPDAAIYRYHINLDAWYLKEGV